MSLFRRVDEDSGQKEEEEDVQGWKGRDEVVKSFVTMSFNYNLNLNIIL